MNAVPGRFAYGVAAVIITATVILGVRVIGTSRAERILGEEALEAGDTRLAITHLRRAIRWYVPFTSHPRAALKSLRWIAKDAESRGDTDEALRAWRAIHAGLSSARSLWVPHKGARDEADDHIAALMAERQEIPVSGLSAVEQAAVMKKGFGIHWLGALAVLGGFAAWVFALVRLSGQSTQAGMPMRTSTFRWRVFAAVALGVFMLGLWFG